MALGIVSGIAVSAAGALTAMTVKGVELGSRLHDLSLETGLTVETLSGLQFQLKQSGSSVESLGNAVLFMHKNLGAAAEGNKNLKATFAALGIKDVDAALKDTDGALRTVIKSLGEMTSEGERDRRGTEALGKGYKDLRVFIADTGGDIDEAMRKAREAGVVMSGEVAGNLDNLGDAWDRLSNKMSVMGANFAGTVAPELTKALDDIGSALSANLTDWETWAQGMAVETGRARGAARGIAQWWHGDTWSPWSLGKDVEQGADAGEVSAMTDMVWNKLHPQQPKKQDGGGGGLAPRGGGGKKGGADKDAQRRLKEIQLDEKDFDADFKREGDALERDYQRRLDTLEQFTAEEIDLLDKWIKEKRAVFDREEAEVRRSAKNEAERELKVREIEQKRTAAEDEYASKRNAAEDKLEEERRRVAEAKADALLKIDEAVGKKRIAAIQGVADLGIKKESDAAKEIGDIQLDLHDKQTQRLKDRLEQEREWSVEYKRIQGELGVAEVERAALIEEVERRVVAAKKQEVEAERQRLEQLRQLRAQARAEGIDIERMEIEAAANDGTYQTRAARLSIIRALADNERKAEEEQHAQRRQDIENLKRDNLERAKTEAERVEALKAYDAQIENETARHQLALGGIKQPQTKEEDAQDPFKPLKDLWGDFKDQSKNSSDSIGKSVESMANTVANSIHAMGGALKQGIAANLLYGESLGKALKKALAEQLAEISAEATIQGLKHAAYALGSLAFGDFGGAARHAAASAGFFALAAATGMAASGFATSAGLKGGTGAAAGSAVASTGSASRTAPQPIVEGRTGGAANPNLPQPIHILVSTRNVNDPGVLSETVVNVISNHPDARDAVVEHVASDLARGTSSSSRLHRALDQGVDALLRNGTLTRNAVQRKVDGMIG
jgi:hypothetical protein